DRARIANADLTLKLLFSLPAAIVLIVISRGRPPAAQFGALIVGLSLLMNSVVEYFGYALRGWQRADLEALWLLAMRVLTAACGGLALFAGTGWAGLTVAYGGSAALTLIASFLWLRRQPDRYFAPRPRFDRDLQFRLLRQALPLGGAIVVSIVYTRTAVFMLDALTSPASVGVYGVAQKLTEPLAIVPAALMAAVFPVLARAINQHGYAATRSIRVRMLAVLMLAGGALAVAGALGGPWLIERLYGEPYHGAAPVVQVLALALPLSFINYGLTHVLIALNRQRQNLIFNVIVFVVNFAACAQWIPTSGPVGAALATALSEGVLLTLCGLSLLRPIRG
ncbi:MAG: polysaccharide biosynthesis C-terminal domain-containing protein, partial [Chloroflexi bacterium]|nr:polysaccharide biosynthesis C-terminal domain-containing protein [Chloroflexota bacterium]